MTPDMEAAAWEGLATNSPAQLAAEGHDTVARWLHLHDQVAISRERLAELEQRANREPVDHTTHDAGSLAFYVRDLMDAAGYPYDPVKPLHDQVRECDQQIRETRDELGHMRRIVMDKDEALEDIQETNAAQVQRLTDLADELRRQLNGADRHIVQLQGQVSDLRKIVMDKDEQIEHLVTDALHDAADKIRALVAQLGPEGHLNADDLIRYIECPCRPDAPQHDHGQGGYRPEDPKVAMSPDGRIWIKNSDGWCIFSPNGEFWESEYGDELTDEQVADWPKGWLPSRQEARP